MAFDSGSSGLGWPAPERARLAPRAAWLRYLVPGTTQVWWIGTVYPGLLARLLMLEGPAEFGQWLVAALGHRDIELIVLRATWNAGHVYHYSAHALWARVREPRWFLAAVQVGAGDPRWDVRRATVLRAVDELHDDLAISPATLRRLREFGYGQRELIEICFITAHYQLLGMLEESAGMPVEPLIGRPSSPAGLLPWRPSAGARRVDTGLNPRTPWTPGGDDVLSGHPALHALLGWYGRGMARRSVLEATEVGAALDRSGSAATPRSLLLRRAVSELDREFFLSDDTWRELLGSFTIRQVLELCVLVGHYRTFEMIVNSMG